MRNLSALLLTFSSLCLAGPVHAASGSIDLTWGVTCTPIVQNLVPTASPQSLIASVLGNDETHNAYQVRCVLGSSDRTIPDAWRFDLAGCQGAPFITIRHLPPATVAPTCPAFQGVNTSYQIKDYDFAPGPIDDPGRILLLLANTYPAGFTTLGATRYFLAQFEFDHTYSVVGATTPGVDCGGFETPLCILLLQSDWPFHEEWGSSSYTRLADGLDHPFDSSPNGILTVHDIVGCPTVPAKNATWGQIKSQYRN